MLFSPKSIKYTFIPVSGSIHSPGETISPGNTAVHDTMVVLSVLQSEFYSIRWTWEGGPGPPATSSFNAPKTLSCIKIIKGFYLLVPSSFTVLKATKWTKITPISCASSYTVSRTGCTNIWTNSSYVANMISSGPCWNVIFGWINIDLLCCFHCKHHWGFTDRKS